MIEQHWTTLHRPEKPDVRPGNDPKRFATMTIEPLERGFGMTLGNALRRVLLSSLRGAAVTEVKIDGVPHEFYSITGVREDVTDIVLNVKRLAIRMSVEGPRRLTLQVKGPKAVTAADIEEVNGIEILNKKHPICHLDEGVDFHMQITVNTGKGYQPASQERSEATPVDAIEVDAIYTPVRRVSYRVEQTREGQVLDFDKLILEVETNGAIKPEDAVAYAARIIQDQMSVFVNFEESAMAARRTATVELAQDPRLRRRIDELELGVRSLNTLKNENIVYIGDLLQKTEREMMMMPNFGKKSLDEIKSALGQMGLLLGTEVPGWPPEDLEKPEETA